MSENIELLLCSFYDCFFLLDNKGFLVRYRCTGKAGEHRTGQHYTDIFPEQGAQNIREALYRLDAGESIVQFDYTVTSLHNWQCFKIALTVDTSVEIPEGRQYIGVMQECTPHPRAEAQMKSGEHLFRTLYEHAPIVIALIDPEGYTLRVNNAFAAMVGYSTDDLISTPLTSVLHPDDRENDRELYRELLEKKRTSYVVEKRSIHRNGYILWGEFHVSMAYEDDGRVEFSICMVHDIKRPQQNVW